MSNLGLWEKVRKVPETAIKQINGGRLKGMSDINPAWRLKTLTEQFGPCGVGWTYVITEKRLENGANEEIAAFVDIDLFIKYGGEWSEAIPGTGGSSFVAKERNGLYTSDECFKMALTDAISVACKALGFGADIYWNQDKTKYGEEPLEPRQGVQSQNKWTDKDVISEAQAKRLFAISGGNSELVRNIITKHGYKETKEILRGKKYNAICKEIEEGKHV